MTSLKLGTRGSQLALVQAHSVAGLLQSRAGIACEVVVIKTSGDRLAEAPLAEIGGKRLFVKELEDELLGGTIDLAIHSSKDMPAILPTGLVLGAVLPREDARDALVLPKGERTSKVLEKVALEDVVRRLGKTPRIGTSSVRRVAQLTRLFPGARFGPIRGNIETRLRKLDTGEFDALVLAAAGLIRLGYGSLISAALPVNTCVPAPGQGIIAVEIRSTDTTTASIIGKIGDPIAAAALTAERVVVTRLGGGCQMPIGAYAVASEHGLTMTAVVVSMDGARAARAETGGLPTEAELVGARVAEQLLERGAANILAEVEMVRSGIEEQQP